MDIKSLSFCQICWAQKLLKYHFQIDYCQGKANRAADTLSRFFEQDEEKKAKLWAENIWIFNYWQFSLINSSILGVFVLASLLFLH